MSLATSYNGVLIRPAEATHAVSYWVVPGGTEYESAFTQVAFFVSETDATRFAERYDMAPEMAIMLTIAQYDACMADLKKQGL